MIVSIASDHRGLQLKRHLTEILEQLGHQIVDLGPASDEPVDYPDFAKRVADSVTTGQSEKGILICGSGIGMSIAANKFPGIRAALCHTVEAALLSRQHNDANVICLAGNDVDRVTAQLILEAWITAEFEAGRHARRVDKISALEGGGNC